MGLSVSTLRDDLLARGYRKFQWRNLNLRFGARIFEKNGKCVVTIPSVEISSPIAGPLSIAVDDYFRRLQQALDELSKNLAITGIFLPGGGTIPIPEWFAEWCRQHNIRIYIVEPSQPARIEDIGI